MGTVTIAVFILQLKDGALRRILSGHIDEILLLRLHHVPVFILFKEQYQRSRGRKSPVALRQGIDQIFRSVAALQALQYLWQQTLLSWRLGLYEPYHTRNGTGKSGAGAGQEMM